ncbi:2-oxo acid dehydrogenase subunit E2, partial [Streptosporangium sp. NPDC048047]|uniref:2-oxo acid dehydrogenase subunit E2 n=1 Tax=Streptosporangium sp. NPDC048047 TaxID=3155748 RepID=UPI003412532A
LLAEGAECAPGQVIARLLDEGETTGEQPGDAAGEARPPGADPLPDAPGPDAGAGTGTRIHAEAGPDTPGPDTIVITEPARALMDELGISPDQVRGLGKKVVRRADLAGLTGPGLLPLSKLQRRVAEVVTASHRDIPAAFTAVRVDVTDALPVARELTRRGRVLVGLPELVVKATGELLDRFPLFFATPLRADAARRAVTADVGVTVDVGKGMYIPVVRDAGRRPPAEIARDLTRFRTTAMNGGFREDDLRDGNITLTLHTGDAVITAVPIVFPGQICALSLPAPRPEVVENGEGGFVTRRVVSLGLAYDHRFVNGREAVEFLGAIRATLERPEGFLRP